MLSVKTTENLAGVTVSGTYWDLNAFVQDSCIGFML